MDRAKCAEKYYGFVSMELRANPDHQTVVWSRPDGSVVEVDFVDKDPDAKGYNWPDKVCIGEVIRCVRRANYKFSDYTEGM